MISVIMAAYNSSKYIGLAIESILSQSFREFEFLIVEDHSTDNTLAIIQKYAAQDERIKVLQTERNSGASVARSLAIASAQYDWLAIMDADDIAKPKRFEKQINAAKEKPHVVAWGSYVQHISSTGKVIGFLPQGPKTEEGFYDTWNKGYIPFVMHPTTLLKKDVFVQAGGYRESLDNHSLASVEDFELMARVGGFGPILAIPEPLVYYRVHSGSLSMQKFYWQRTVMQYVYARHQAQLAGIEAPSLNQFLEERESQPMRTKLPSFFATRGQFNYRKAGLLFGEKNYGLACWHLFLAIALYPSYSLKRVWNQKLSPSARRKDASLEGAPVI